MTKEELLEKANSLPLAPGVYLMHSRDGEVIYVGKAKKLKNRVSQYFQAGRGHNLKTHAMVGQVDDFDTIIVGSEFEALVLENALIKQYMPRYNILLKDDKGYPFVRLSREAYPKFSIVSRVSDDGARYFGPYGGRFETRSALDAVRAALHLPTCTKTFPRDIGKERPCLNHHMGRCDGFCRAEMTAEEYNRRIDLAVQLLEGKVRLVTADLEREMLAAAEELLQGRVELCVAQDVADDDNAAGLFGLLPEGDALVEFRGDRLFQEDVVALIQGLEGLGHMLAVLGGDDHDVGEFGLVQELLIAGEAHVLGDAVALTQEGELTGTAVCAGDDFHFFRVLGLEGSVGLQATVATAADGECYRFVHRFFSPRSPCSFGFRSWA